MKMIIDNKGKVFGKVNIVDITIIVIIILLLAIIIKFIFFPVNYFQYRYFLAEINYTHIPRQDLSLLSIGNNFLYGDDNSYIVVPEGKQVDCYIYITAEETNVTANTSTGDYIPRMMQDLCYFTALPMNSSAGTNWPEENAGKKSNMVCQKNVGNLTYISYTVSDKAESFCTASFLFKLKTRIIDGEPYYPQYTYHIAEGEYADMMVGNLELYEGQIMSVTPYKEGEDD